MAINFIQNHGSSYKFILNQQINDKLSRTTQRLAMELDILRNRDLGLASGKITEENKEKTSLTKQDDLTSQSIKDILDIRERLGITKPSGNNIPLEELFQSNKGTVLDKKS